MNLYKISWSSSILLIDFYSPQFLEAPNDLKALSKFITLFETKSLNSYAPKNIEIKEICEVDKIIKY